VAVVRPPRFDQLKLVRAGTSFVLSWGIPTAAMRLKRAQVYSGATEAQKDASRHFKEQGRGVYEDGFRYSFYLLYNNKWDVT